MQKKALVIVESPSKAKTIQKYLGKNYIVKASVGHIKDLPKNKLGVDVKKGFKPDYQLIPSKTKTIDELKKAAQRVNALYLATDPDREGEAIAWHIQEELKARGRKIYRVLFNAITQTHVLEAMTQPQVLDENKYNAQQARRVLDRLVGYKISPLLWDKVKRGISAGRVQSVALRLIVEREAEIRVFQPEEYWTMDGVFSHGTQELQARLFKRDHEDIQLPDQSSVNIFLQSIQNTLWEVGAIQKKERTRKATPPFITSRLQQEAARKLGFSAKKTMALAQRLYEGVDLGELGTHGLITYMRTDSVRIEPGALGEVRTYIQSHYGEAYLPATAYEYKTKKSAQDAHEAIRPSSLAFPPESVQSALERDEFRLYQLIWNRFVASQMNPAVYDQTSIDILGKDHENRLVQFRATGSVLRFPGFTAVYTEGSEDTEIEHDKLLKIEGLAEHDPLSVSALEPVQHFTLPPPRYTDASLIRDLEEKGIGRPSTYATILSNLQDREYVEKRETRYYPSELGGVVSELLSGSFPEILNTEFTAAMEDQLDDIEAGKANWKKTLSQFWKPFEKTLDVAKQQMKDIKRQEVPTDVMCEKCGHFFVIKWGKLGSFLACSHYPDCKNTQDFKKDDQGKIVIVPKEYTDKKCEKCSNPMVVKGGKFGKFLACSDYPNCKYTQAMTLGIACPECQKGEIAQKQSRYKRLFYSCNRWPECHFATWDKPIAQSCPQCHFAILLEKVTRRAGLVHKCCKKECGYMEVIDPHYGKVSSGEEPQATENS